MTFKDLLAQLLERGNALQTFWGFYITLSLGMIAFLSSAKLGRRLWQVALILTLAFAAFAAVNGGGMVSITHQRAFLHGRLARLARADAGALALMDSTAADTLIRITEPPSPESVRNFHIAADFIVVSALWTLVYLRYREQREPGESPGA